VYFIRVSVKYLTLGVLGPSFVATGDEMRSQDEDTTEEKKGVQASFLT
jgi:hypothetical protein